MLFDAGDNEDDAETDTVLLNAWLWATEETDADTDGDDDTDPDAEIEWVALLDKIGDCVPVTLTVLVGLLMGFSPKNTVLLGVLICILVGLLDSVLVVLLVIVVVETDGMLILISKGITALELNIVVHSVELH